MDLAWHRPYRAAIKGYSLVGRSRYGDGQFGNICSGYFGSLVVAQDSQYAFCGKDVKYGSSVCGQSLGRHPGTDAGSADSTRIGTGRKFSTGAASIDD